MTTVSTGATSFGDSGAGGGGNFTGSGRAAGVSRVIEVCDAGGEIGGGGGGGGTVTGGGTTALTTTGGIAGAGVTEGRAGDLRCTPAATALYGIEGGGVATTGGGDVMDVRSSENV